MNEIELTTEETASILQVLHQWEVNFLDSIESFVSEENYDELASLLFDSRRSVDEEVYFRQYTWVVDTLKLLIEKIISEKNMTALGRLETIIR